MSAPNPPTIESPTVAELMRGDWDKRAIENEDAQRLAGQSGFFLESFTGEGTQYFWLCFRKPGVS